MAMSNLPMLIGCAMVLVGILWFLWPRTQKLIQGQNFHVALEDLISQTESPIVKQHLRAAGKAAYEVDDGPK
jgi:hypothetical protein